MTAEHLRRIIGAQNIIIDALLEPFWGARVAPPPQVTAALLEIRRLTEGPVLDLEQNLVDGVWEAE
jgi:hypothetical protein